VAYAVILGCGNNAQVYLQTGDVQLADPMATIDSIVFINSATLSINPANEQSEIYYRLNNGSFQLWSKPVTLHSATKVECFVNKEGYLNSDTISLQAIKSKRIAPDSKVSITPMPNKKYPGLGPESLIDLKAGDVNFTNNNNWLGFQDTSIEIHIEPNEDMTFSSVLISLMDDNNSWIYLPSNISIYGDNEQVGQKKLLPRQKEKSNHVFIEVSILNQKYDALKIVIESISEIPLERPGAGNVPWLFIDEIILN